MKQQKIAVIGAGVSGLSSAILLAKAGHTVCIYAKDLTMDTTSNIAAAFWYPYLCNPKDKAITWSKDTYDYLVKNTLDEPDAGTRFIRFTEYLKEKSPDPWWRPAVEQFERPSQDELPDGYIDGYRTKAILMDTTHYLPWLLAQADHLGISITQKTISSIEDVLGDFDAVINCSGLGAREVCGDDSVFPVRGQVLRVRPNGFDEVISDDSEGNLAYVIPRFDDVILGGTAQPNDWNLSVSDSDTDDIIRKISAITPAFQAADIIEVKVGLRPARPEIRLEKTTVNNKVVVHNYGHGGAGFTLSWGCAMEVAQLIEQSQQASE